LLTGEINLIIRHQSWHLRFDICHSELVRLSGRKEVEEEIRRWRL
jgi:hypothetical protein